MKYYICLDCDKVFSWMWKPKEKAVVIKKFLGKPYAGKKRIPACCDRPLREITKADYKRIKSEGYTRNPKIDNRVFDVGKRAEMREKRIQEQGNGS